MRGAHRIAWKLTNGPIPDETELCHHSLLFVLIVLWGIIVIMGTEALITWWRNRHGK
jgi:hypothetical protein